MKIAVFDIHQFEKPFFTELNANYKFNISFFENSLTEKTVQLASGFKAICSHPNDKINATVLKELSQLGVKLIALRSAGFNHVDIPAAAKLNIKVVRVPAYSPYAVAEFATTMILALNRKICRASSRVHDLNFSLEGLVGFDLHGKTIGIIGAGKIGSVLTKIMTGFGCKVLIFDPKMNPDLIDKYNAQYVSLYELYKLSDIITLHVPLTASTHHLIDAVAFSKMKKGVMFINTGRGGLIDAKALISALKSGQIGSAGLDVYEEEENLFSQDLSGTILFDDILARLMTFPNVLITAHQAFLTDEALHNIVSTTLQNIQDFEKNIYLANEVVVS